MKNKIKNTNNSNKIKLNYIYWQQKTSLNYKLVFLSISINKIFILGLRFY